MNSTTTQTVQIATPAPLHTRDSSASFESPGTDLYVFGYKFTSSGASSEVATTVDHTLNSCLPTLKVTATLSQTTQRHTPATLAMYLFRFGFLFPPFWLMGAFIIFSPLRAPPSIPSSSPFDEESSISAWLPEKTEAEKEAFISHMRKAELKWAKRCLIAFVVFAVITGIASGLAILKGGNSKLKTILLPLGGSSG